jgi:hypothetical protein
MFEPMSARLASSCSRNGISAAAGDTSWIGEMSMNWISSGATFTYSPRSRTVIRSPRIRPVFLSIGVFAGATL